MRVLSVAAVATALEVGIRSIAPVPYAPLVRDIALGYALYVLAASPALLANRFGLLRPAVVFLLASPFALMIGNVAVACGMHSRVKIVALSLTGLLFGALVARMNRRLLVSAAVVPCLGLMWTTFEPMRTAGTSEVSVLMVVLDTTSARRLSTYGYEKPTGPNLTKLAQRCLLYRRAVATAPWTIPSHASIFSGLYPSQLGFDGLRFAADRDVGSVAADLAGSGRDAYGISANPLLPVWNGLQVGFAKLWGLTRLVRPLPVLLVDKIRGKEHFRSRGERVTKLALDWVDRLSTRGRPWFLFLNYLDPHAPYTPPRRQAREFAPGIDPSEVAEITEMYNSSSTPLTARARTAMSALYDGEVAAVDEALGTLLEALRARGYDQSNLILIVTSDHGESLGEHGFVGHLLGLPNAVLQVPLILCGPSIPPGIVSEPVQLVQLRATLRALLGMPAVGEIAGPLPPWGKAPELLISEHPEPAWYLNSLGELNQAFTPPAEWRGNWVAVERDGIKVVFNEDGMRGATYDVTHDPAETNPLPLGMGKELIQAYHEQLQAFESSKNDLVRSDPLSVSAWGPTKTQ